MKVYPLYSNKDYPKELFGDSIFYMQSL